MKVEQFINKNQFHLYSDMIYEQENGKQIDILQSYDSTVIKIITIDYDNSVGACTDRTITLGVNWNYSNTTSKHVYAFLEEYGNINFNGITNKRAYINKLINDGVIQYDANMR